jgi:hypothetical protein
MLLLRTITVALSVIFCLAHLQPTAAEMVPQLDQIKAVKGLLKRRFPDVHHHFTLDLTVACSRGHAACFEVETDGKFTVAIRGTTGNQALSSESVTI